VPHRFATKKKLKDKASKEAVISRILHYLVNEEGQANIIVFALGHDSVSISDGEID
jgi:hypothetical protein